MTGPRLGAWRMCPASGVAGEVVRCSPAGWSDWYIALQTIDGTVYGFRMSNTLPALPPAELRRPRLVTRDGERV